MLEVKKTTTTSIRIEITGDLTIDGERIAWLTAYIGPDDNENPIVNMRILDRETYQDNFETVQAEEKEFEAYVCESDKVAMTQSEEITDVFNPDDEPDGDDEPDDSGDEPDDDDDKTGAGSEETIIP